MHGAHSRGDVRALPFRIRHACERINKRVREELPETFVRHGRRGRTAKNRRAVADLTAPRRPIARADTVFLAYLDAVFCGGGNDGQRLTAAAASQTARRRGDQSCALTSLPSISRRRILPGTEMTTSVS
jgi:hypothetical protein